MGLLLAVLVTAADVDDAKAAAEVFGRLEGQPMSRVERMFADSKYHNYTLYQWVEENARWEMAIVRSAAGKRWLGETADSVDGRTDIRLAGQVPSAEQGPGAKCLVIGVDDQVGHDPPHAESA